MVSPMVRTLGTGLRDSVVLSRAPQPARSVAEVSGESADGAFLMAPSAEDRARGPATPNALGLGGENAWASASLPEFAADNC